MRASTAVPTFVVLHSLLAFAPAAAQSSALPGPGSGVLMAGHSGLCLAVRAGNIADGAAVTQQPCGAGPEQIWEARVQRGGYAYVNRMSGKCLNVSGLSGTMLAQGTAVFQWACSGSATDTWTVEAVSGGYRLVAQASGRCLNVYESSTAAGVGVIQWDCLNTANETFSSPTVTAAGTGIGRGGATWHAGSAVSPGGERLANLVAAIGDVVPYDAQLAPTARRMLHATEGNGVQGIVRSALTGTAN